MKTIRLFALACIAAVVLSGCVSTQVTSLSRNSFPPLHKEDVDIYLTEKDIDGDYEKIGLIHLKGDSDWIDEKDMIDKARERAAELGANGIVLREFREPSVTVRVAEDVIGVNADLRGEVIAVYVFEDTTGE